MDLNNYEFLEEETNERPDIDLEDTLDLKEQLIIVKEKLTDTIIADEEDLYEQE